MLIAVRGKSANYALLDYARKNIPCLIVDCANVADPHSLPFENPQVLDQIYVIQAEVIYSLRACLKKLNKLRTDTILITTFRLFDYGDENENRNIYKHCWILIKNISKRKTVVIGIDSEQEYFASKYADKVINWDTLQQAKGY